MAFLSQKLPWELAQPKWAATLNPVIANPLINGNLISDFKIVGSIATPINHLLQRMPIGWFLVDVDTETSIWRSAPFTKLTLTLISAGDATISLWVF